MQKIIQMIVNAILAALVERLAKPAYRAIERKVARKKTAEDQAKRTQAVKGSKDEDSFNSSVDDL